jgi:hypothetical protein
MADAGGALGDDERVRRPLLPQHGLEEQEVGEEKTAEAAEHEDNGECLGIRPVDIRGVLRVRPPGMLSRNLLTGNQAQSASSIVRERERERERELEREREEREREMRTKARLVEIGAPHRLRRPESAQDTAAHPPVAGEGPGADGGGAGREGVAAGDRGGLGEILPEGHTGFSWSATACGLPLSHTQFSWYGKGVCGGAGS